MNENRMNEDLPQALRALLLRCLPPAQAELLEERVIQDGSIADQLEIAAADLIDDYSRGELSAEDAKRVEDYVLSAPDGQQRLAFAAALKQVIAPMRSQSRTSWRVAGTWRNRGLAAAACLALAVFSVIEFRGVWPSHGTPPHPANSMPRIEAHRPENVPIVSFTLALLAGQLRGTESELIAIPADVERVRIQCEIPSSESSALYRLTLEGTAGQIMASMDKLSAMRAGGISYVEASVDAHLLLTGRYRVAIFAASRPEIPVVTRTFAVERRYR